MKLLLDQNVSPRLVQALAPTHPGTTHVRELGLQSAADAEIWELAQREGFAIVSKDSDFHQLSFLYGAPPKVVWLRLGNCTTDRLLERLLESAARLAEFADDPEAAFLVVQ